MGNLCSKSANKPSPSSSDPFSTPGRTLSSAPPPAQNPRAQIPKGTLTSTSQGRRLGGGNGNGDGDGAGEGETDGVNDARSAAARAAESRAATSASGRKKGKLARELEKQRGQSRTEALAGVSWEERRRREVEGVGREVRAWD
ncbi:MAG: hypothetical protein LQ338_005430 [Usnochroma carphineum]|nr:MAG: hypothetical protein LQ338_005430 [Usnochroma carphineum]